MTKSSAGIALCALAPNSWNGQWVNRQQLLSRVGRRHHVVYTTGAWFSWDRGATEYVASPWFGGFADQDNVLVDRPPRIMLRWPRFTRWDRFIVGRHASRLRRAVSGSRELPFVTYVCHPQFLPYIEPLRGDRLVYHVYDLYSHQPGWNAGLAEAQAELLSKADLVFCPTRLIADELKKSVSREIRILPNAADIGLIDAAFLARTPDPADLAHIPHPRIGYIGSIHPQVDLDLVAELAERNSAWHFVLIGPESKTDELHASESYRRCLRTANVHFLGSKHREEVPAYLVNMDAHIMCYRTTASSWTRFGHPLKLYEYLASGRPIVSVDLPTVKDFSGVIAFANGLAQWEAALSRAIERGLPATTEQRRTIASGNSWDARARVLEQWLAEVTQVPPAT